MPAPITPAAAAVRAAAGVDNTVGALGPQGAQAFAPGEVDAIKTQIAPTVQQNPTASPSAIVRAQDFRNLGMQPTLGQITRDPMQYAAERNIRSLPSVGDPLTMRFNAQSAQLQNSLSGLAGQPADAFTAGTQLQTALKAIDDNMGQQVSDAYAAARAASGKNLDVPLQGLAQDYAQTLNDFGDKVPSGVRNNFNALGLQGGTQRRVFSVGDAENLLKVINANQSNDPATNAALGQLRTSVKNAVLGADDQGGVFAPARQLAAQRFALQDQIPALGAAVAGNVAPEDFIPRFILNGKTNDVLATANLLQQSAPSVFDQMRSQIGAQLARAGFGTNPAGDAAFSPGGYANALHQIGDAKPGAFYSPDEIAQLHTIGRVGAYINSLPSAAPVNTSNTAGALASLANTGLKNLPGFGKFFENTQNKAFVNRALAASLSNAPTQPVPQPSTPFVPLPGLLAPGMPVSPSRN